MTFYPLRDDFEISYIATFFILLYYYALMNRTHAIILIIVLIGSLFISMGMVIKERFDNYSNQKNYVYEIHCKFNSDPQIKTLGRSSFNNSLNFFDITKRELNYNVNVTFPNKTIPMNLKGILSFKDNQLLSGHVHISNKLMSDKLMSDKLTTFDHKSKAATIDVKDGNVNNILLKLPIEKESLTLTFKF